MEKKQEKAGRLQQMSEDMKEHIAQLKAELSNTEVERRNTDVEKEFRNKAVATALRRHLENSVRTKSMDDGILMKSGATSEPPPLKQQHESEILVPIITDQSASCKSYQSETSRLPETNPDLLMESNILEENLNDHSNLGSITQPDEPNIPQDPDTNIPHTSMQSSKQSSESLVDCNPSTSNSSLPAPVNGSNELTSGSSPQKLSQTVKRRTKYSDSTTDTSSSSPRSTVEGGEEGIPVKYLQMSTASPRAAKRKKGSRHFQRRSASEDMLDPGQNVTASQFAELEARLTELQEQCELLAEENLKIKKEQRSKAEEKISSLKKRNGELANIARKLEEKARSLQEQNVKKTQEMAAITRDLQQQKRSHQRHKGRCDAEYTRLLAEKDDLLANTQAQLEDLKKALRQARREKFLKSKEGDIDAMKQTQKEMLHLQKLAAAASSKVVVRSLSTPVTARQKILEESNRNLRRQITTLEGTVQELEAKLGQVEGFDEKLKSLEAEKQQIQIDADKRKQHIFNLESQLQESKVEASDSSVQLHELKNIHRQLQDEYSTVHEQLSVAIRERDQAVSTCVEHAHKVSDMETTLRTLQDDKQAHANLQTAHKVATESHRQEIGNLTSVHENMVAGYKQALESLQTKVNMLEQQCQEQDLNNKNLKDQLSSLVEWTKQNSKQTTNTTVPENRNVNNNNHANDLLQPISIPNNKTVPDGTARAPKSPLAPSPTRQFTTSGPLSAFRKPTVTSRNPPTRKVTSLATSSSSHRALDLDDTEAEEIEDEMAPAPHVKRDPALTTDPGNGDSPLRVFIAKYTYNPYEGPNENPEAELSLVAGDYVYVHGPMDDDGFFEGELMNGRRGLVPSNFLEPVQDAPPTNGLTGNDFPTDDVMAPTSHRSKSKEEGVPTIGRFRSIDSDVSHSFGSSSGDLESRDLNTLSSDDSARAPPSVLPFPRKLRVDKKLSHSLIIGWIAPQLNDDDIVEEYHVLVDGCLATVANGSKSKAVVEHIYHDKNCYAISVCAVTERGRSEANHCTIKFGHRHEHATIDNPRVEHVTTGCARVAWEPVNSNFVHSVAVGEITEENKHIDRLIQYQRQILVPCPMFRQTITGLKPSTTYEVMVKCRNAKNDVESSSLPLRFTTPTIGPPDPPLSVQVQENLSGSTESVQITWLPVTLKENGLSNGVSVKGYTIHVNDFQIASIEQSTSDQCRLTIETLSNHVTRIVDADLSYQQRTGSGATGGLSSSSSSSVSQRSLYAHCLPSVKVSVRTVATGGQVSDFSTPYHLHRSLVTRLLRTLPKQVVVKRSPAINGIESRLAKEESSSAKRKADKKSQPVVPSIEITYDTSSGEEEGKEEEGRSSLHNSNANIRRTRSTGKSSHREIPPAQLREISRNLDGKRSKSASNIRNHHNRSSAAAPARSDEESEASVSSEGHGSTSSGSSRRFKGNSRGQMWVNGVGKGRKTGSSWREGRDGKTNSPHSLHSHDRVATDGSWNSQNSNNQRGSKSETLSRKAYHNQQQQQLQKRLQNASSQSGGSASEIDIVDDSRVSLFVALYDYDPYVMSPNTDMLDDELSFTEGQLLKVYGDKDADGFYFGEKPNGKSGHIPCNMISEVQVDDYTMLSELFERGHLPSASPRDVRMNHSSSDQNLNADESRAPPEERTKRSDSPRDPVRTCVALFDYDPKESSPNIDAEAELSFRRGEFVKIFGSMDEDGFYRGELDGKIGLVPSNFLEEVTEQQISAMKNSDRDNTRRNNTVSATTMTDVSTLAKPSSAPNHHTPSSAASTSSNASTQKSDSFKRKSIISKGKKFFKKLGTNDPKPKR